MVHIDCIYFILKPSLKARKTFWRHVFWETLSRHFSRLIYANVARHLKMSYDMSATCLTCLVLRNILWDRWHFERRHYQHSPSGLVPQRTGRWHWRAVPWRSARLLLQEGKYATSSAGKGIEQACFDEDVVNLNSRKGKTDGGSNGNDSNNDTVMAGDRSKAVGRVWTAQPTACSALAIATL